MSESDEMPVGDGPSVLAAEEVSAELTEKDELVRLFVGGNFEAYEDVYRKRETRNKNAMGWCWAGFFAPFVWLFYRKLYIEGVVVLVLPIIISVLFPRFDFASGGISIVIALSGKNYYLQRADKKIEKIMALQEPEETKRELLVRAGGVSWPAAIFGLAVMASLLALVIVATTMKA